MTIELTVDDCWSIYILAKYAREYLTMKREVLLETKTAVLGEIERVENEIKIAGDFMEKFDRLHLTGRLVDRVMRGEEVHN